MDSKTTQSLFKEKYPNLYSNLKSVINNVKDKRFFANLMRIYGIVQNQNSQKVRKLNRYWKKLLNSGLDKQHPLFQLLIYYLPFGISIYHAYSNELEGALGNANITFEKKEQKIRALTRKDEFWDTYFELEVANSLAKEGCRVLIQENIKRFDMRASLNNINFNVEVTAIRLDDRGDEKSVCQIITKKIEKKATQLPRHGINIIVLAVPLDSKLMPFDILDALYGGSPVVKLIRSPSAKKSFIKKVRRPLILETNSKLSNISAVVSWVHKWRLIEMLGKQGRLIRIDPRQGFPPEIKDVFVNINRQTKSS